MTRKNARDFLTDERSRFCNALLTLKQTTEPGHVLNKYDEFVALHWGVVNRVLNGVSIGDGGHRAPGFLPWHREYLNRFEKAVQSVDSTLSIPYWDWSSGDSQDTTDIFTDDFIGPAGDSLNGNRITSGYFIENDWPIHPELDQLGWGLGLRRSNDLLTPQKLTELESIGDRAQDAVNGDNDFATFLSELEGAHNSVHVWVNFHMVAMTSPNDPIFFLHHANIDRLWSKWQETHPGAENFNPDNSGQYGHRIDDGMWPWDGSTNITTSSLGTSTNMPIQSLLPQISDYDVVTPRNVLDDNLTIPQIVKQFLSSRIRVTNQTTNNNLNRYKIIGSVPDKFAAMSGITDQILTTVGFEDRVNRPESDYDFVDVILEISHTRTQINSARGVQLGGDNIEIFVDGNSTGNLVKTQEIPL